MRVIAATHRELEARIEKGEFREDLYYRLNVLNIVIPPLRERLDEIIPLASSFLRKHSTAGHIDSGDRSGFENRPAASSLARQHS